jgi:hypothetical protein
MGNGTSLRLDIGFTAPTKYLNAVDRVEAAGTLLLIEAAHTLGGFPSGAPVDGAKITNLVRDNAAQILGATDKTTLDAPMQVVAMSGTTGKVERTPRGGIHAIQSSTQTGSNQGFQTQIPLPIIAYIKANPSHSYYFSHWATPTKLGTGSQDEFGGAMQSASDSYLFGLGTVAAGGSQGGTSLGAVGNSRGTVNTPMIRNQGVTAPSTSFTGQANTAGRYSIFELGNFLTINAGTGKSGLHGAHVFYRGYIEDLTVSGRAYADAYAADLSEFNKQFASGGRYYGDTIPTDPATLP